MPNYCKRCNRRSQQRGLCDDCLWARGVERRLAMGNKRSKELIEKLGKEPSHVTDLWNKNIKRYKNSPWGKGIF